MARTSRPRLHSRMRSTLKSCSGLVQTVLPFHASAWSAVSEPIQHMLNSADDEQLCQLADRWHDDILQQLNIVCVTSALVGAVVATAFSWPILNGISPTNNNTVLALWYASLLLAVVSIATASQQYVALGRLSSFPDRAVRLRGLLGYQTAQGWRPRRLQLFIWQTPVMMLNGSIYIFVIGLSVVVYGSTIALKEWRKDELKVVIVFSLALVTSVVCYVVTAIGLYQRLV